MDDDVTLIRLDGQWSSAERHERKMFGFSIVQRGTVPESILVWYVFDMISTPNTQK